MAEQQTNMKERFLELIEKYKSPDCLKNGINVMRPNKVNTDETKFEDGYDYIFTRETPYYQRAIISLSEGKDFHSISIETFDNDKDEKGKDIYYNKLHNISIGTDGVSAQISTCFVPRVTGHDEYSESFSYLQDGKNPARLTIGTTEIAEDGETEKKEIVLEESEEAPLEFIWEVTKNPINVHLFQNALSVIELRLPGITEFLEEFFPEYSAFIGTQNTKNARQLSTQKA